jgi:hypothetical protein
MTVVAIELGEETYAGIEVLGQVAVQGIEQVGDARS